MKIYLASQYSWKDKLKEHAAELRELGIEVTSRWLEEPHASITKITEVRESQLRLYSKQDLEDVAQADILVAFSVDPSVPTHKGGRHVEFGYALGLEKSIIVVGPRENIFHYLPEEYGIIHVPDWESAKQLLSKWRRKE